MNYATLKEDIKQPDGTTIKKGTLLALTGQQDLGGVCCDHPTIGLLWVPERKLTTVQENTLLHGTGRSTK